MRAARPPELVLFDCDGVIVDSERITNLYLQENLARHGLDIPLEELMSRFVGGTMSDAGDEARRRGAALPDTWLDDFYEELYARLAEQVEPIPGITLALDALDTARIPYAVCSNGRTRKMQVMLTRTGLWDRLKDRLYSAQELCAPKPAPDIYLKAAADHGIDPSACAVIEDSPTGARAAQAANMRCLAYTASTPQAKLTPFADTLFGDMTDLPHLLGLA